MAEHVFDVTAFRQLFPEFADPDKYPDDTLSRYWNWATLRICPYDNWFLCGDRLQYVLNLMTAHLARLGQQSASGDDPGGGMVQSASEGSVSVAMAVFQLRNAWQYWLMKTPYGQELLALFEMLTAGGFYFGGKPEGSAIRDVGGIF